MAAQAVAVPWFIMDECPNEELLIARDTVRCVLKEHKNKYTKRMSGYR